MATEKHSINKIQPPALPVTPVSPVQQYMEELSNILRLFFFRVTNNLNLLTGKNGGRFVEAPNGLFFDDADQPLATVNVAQPVRFNQTYLDNAMLVNGGTTSEITMVYSGIYNFQFSAILRSSSASSKIAYIWIARNGINIGYSAREYVIAGATGVLEVNWSFNIDVQGGQYIQIFWTGDTLNLSLDAVAPTSIHPGIASAAMAVSFVSTLPDVLPTPP